jgi:RimJ/RimL family protein N-acetyltransferase
MKAFAHVWLFLGRLREEFTGSEYLGLRCDLTALPDVRRAKLPLTMTPRSARQFGGFDAELRRVTGRSYIDVFVRQAACERGIDTLFVADDQGDPGYAQWLITPANQDALHAFQPERYSRLADDEVLLEWAYTFVRFRRLGLMTDGMHQLLVTARDEGYASAVTYVGAENVGSLRGCANVGFVLDHVRRNTRRLGRAVTSVSSPSEEHQQMWNAAVGATRQA